MRDGLQGGPSEVKKAYNLEATADVTAGDDLIATDDLTVGDDATVSGDLAVTGGVAVNTNKFTVAAATGNTVVAGTLGVTGDVAVNTNKFNVTAASGNTTVAGTLGVTGATTLTDDLTVNGGDASVIETADGAVGAELTLEQVSASPAALDAVGNIIGAGKDDGGNDQDYAKILLTIENPADGSEAGAIAFQAAAGGSLANTMVAGSAGLALSKNLVYSSEAVAATSEGVAASTAVVLSAITTNGDSDLDNVTLADGATDGQVKKFVVSAVGNAADSVKITPAKMIGGSIITFAANPLGLGCEFVWNAAADGWIVSANNGGTIS